MWIIENNVFSEQNELEKAAISLNKEIVLAEYNPLSQTPIKLSKEVGKDNTVIAWGSIGFCRRVRREYPWASMVPDKVFDWSFYAPRIGKHLLNHDSIILPFGMILNYAPCIDMFVKPDNGYKPFTGRVIKKLENLKKELEIIQDESTIFPEELCVISRYQKIKREFRFLVVNSKIITGSQYLPSEYEIFPTHSSFQYAESVLRDIEYDPEIAWTLDVCEVEHHNFLFYSVLEVNSFSSAGLYKMDMKKVVESVSNAVIEEAY